MDRETFEEAVNWATLVQQLSPSYGEDPEFSFERRVEQLARSEGFADDLMFELVEASQQHLWAWEVLNSVVSREFRMGPRDLPEFVWQWAAQKLEGSLSPPSTGGLNDPVKCIVIADTVHIVRARYGVKPTRNRPGVGSCCAEGGSACDIVGSAQAGTGELRGYKAIERIWRIYRRLSESCWSEGSWQEIVNEWVRRPENLFGGLPRRHARILSELRI